MNLMYSSQWQGSQALKNVLSQLKCAKGLSPLALDHLASVGVLRKLPANSRLWEHGDPGEFLAIVTHGFVEVTRFNKSNEEHIMGIFGQNDIIGISAILQKINYPGCARVLTKDTQIIKCFLRPILQEKTPHSLELTHWIREQLLLHEQILRDKIDILNAGTVEYRVYELVSQLARRFGDFSSPTQCRIPLSLTRVQIAKLINARTETVIRLLTKWKKERVLSISKTEIAIDNMTLLEKSLKET